MSKTRFKTFQEFWPYYLSEHSKPWTRRLHYLGTSSALFFILWALWSQDYSNLWILPLVGYGPAWISHFYIEKNRPATFAYPAWSLAADLKMWLFMLTNQRF